MTDAKLAARIERAVVDAVHKRSGASDPAGTADEVARIIAGTGARGAGDVIAESVLTGIRCAAARLDRVRMAVTGTGWVGGGVGSVEDMLLSLLRGAKHEVLLTAYAITVGSSSVLDEVERAIATGVRTCLVVDQFADQEPTIKDRLRVLADRFPATFKLYDFGGGTRGSHLHAKVVVIDRRSAVVGSANLTYHGMMTAHELAVIIEGPEAELIAQRIDLLLQSPCVREIAL